MVNQLVNSGNVSASDNMRDVRAIMHGLARDIPDEDFKTGLVDAWIKMAILPKVKEKYGEYDTGGDRPVESLQICNDCAKSFRAVEAVCAYCKSKNTDKIVKEEDYNTGRRQEQLLLIAAEKEIEGILQNADDYDKMIWPHEAEDIIEWIKENEPEVYQLILNDPEEIPERGSEAFFAAMEHAGIIKKKKEDFAPDEDARSDRQDRGGPDPTNEYEGKADERGGGPRGDPEQYQDQPGDSKWSNFIQGIVDWVDEYHQDDDIDQEIVLEFIENSSEQIYEAIVEALERNGVKIHGPNREAKVKEEEGDYEILGRSFPTKEAADEVARKDGGQVVADADDNEKFMVIKKKEAV